MDRTEILAQAGRWADADGSAALATVIETWGSAPRAAGSLLAVSRRGGFVGSVSGGCVERAVIEAAQEAIDDGRHRVLSFGVADADAWALGLACGGRIRVLVEPVARTPDFTEWEQAVAAGRPAVRATDLETGSNTLRYPDDEAAAAVLAADQAQLSADGRLFLNPFSPPLRLVLVGAVHIAEPLARMATIAGYAVTVVEGRRAFARAELFPDAALRAGWPAEILPDLGLDQRSAVITLTHDPKFDDGALAAALATPAFYIGALGSKKTHAKRLARLAVAGFDTAALARVHGPVGLDIGAGTPGQIAVAILAEMTAVLHGRLS
ncbi:XdhC family protein [Zavarzinia compransoris]|uniref:XdhC/CoxI family protein n=1 Tax=Zavarzinia compransoris TaxID=1264899 RepID=A0A317E6I0_9PROT|nr:XdhC/CoxI family protein [Zavarzinia compransoris]PWR21013.1 XdhC/CoxI family protein [Zavarzinia compransoris]TDP44045.1 xanthine dehydrogenase accessory factor [Zavarzinia compransoris]